jgi:hypothetical protein
MTASNPPGDLWITEIGTKFEAWFAELKSQAEAAGVYGPIGIEIFKPLADQGEAVIVRPMYIMKDGAKIPAFVGPFKRDKDVSIRYVDPATKRGTIVSYYAARKHDSHEPEPRDGNQDVDPNSAGAQASTSDT